MNKPLIKLSSFLRHLSNALKCLKLNPSVHSKKVPLCSSVLFHISPATCTPSNNILENCRETVLINLMVFTFKTILNHSTYTSHLPFARSLFVNWVGFLLSFIEWKGRKPFLSHKQKKSFLSSWWCDSYNVVNKKNMIINHKEGFRGHYVDVEYKVMRICPLFSCR